MNGTLELCVDGNLNCDLHSKNSLTMQKLAN